MPTALLGQDERVRSEGLRLSGEGHEEAEALLPSPPPKQLEAAPEENVDQDSTEHTQETKADVGPLVRILPGRAPRRRFEILQQWEGVVSEVAGDAVWANLLDLTDPSKPAEIVELPLAEIAEADRPLALPGSVFYWSIGYERSQGGQISRVSEIRMRRTPEWSQHVIESVKRKASELLDQLSSHGEHESATAQ